MNRSRTIMSSVMSPVLQPSNCQNANDAKTHTLPTVYEADHDGQWRDKFTILDLAVKLSHVWPDFAGGFSTHIDDIMDYPVQRRDIDPDMPWTNCRSKPLEPYFSVEKQKDGGYQISFIYGNMGAVSANITSSGQAMGGAIS